MVAMVAMIAGVVASMLLGMPFVPQKPTLAGFTEEIMPSVNSTQPGGQTIQLIIFYQASGDILAYFWANGTSVRLIDPDSITCTVENDPLMTGSEIQIGERLFMFKTSGSPDYYLITNNQSRISGIKQFTPHGTWRFIITDEKETNMVIFEKDLTL